MRRSTSQSIVVRKPSTSMLRRNDFETSRATTVPWTCGVGRFRSTPRFPSTTRTMFHRSAGCGGRGPSRSIRDRFRDRAPTTSASGPEYGRWCKMRGMTARQGGGRRTKPSAPLLPSSMIVDDHPMWRETLRQVLEETRVARVVAESGDGLEAIKEARRTRPDIIIMDIDLPSLGGVEVTRRILKILPKVRVLMLSSSNARAHVVEAIQAGATGYLVKTVGSKEIADAVVRIQRGDLVFPSNVASMVMDQLRTAGGARPRSAAPRESTEAHPATFVKQNDFWILLFEGRESHIKDSRGMGYLAALLRTPRKEIHVLVLATAGVAAPRSESAKTESLSVGSGDDPVLDSQAIAAYRRRISEIQEEIDQAESWNETERFSRLTEEMQEIESTLTSALGLSGRVRSAPSAAGRARVSVRNAIAAALKTIRANDERLWQHLSRSTRTGTFCVYDPEDPPNWSL